MTIFCLQRNTLYNVFNYKTTPVQTMGTVIQALSLSVVHQHYNHHLSNWLGRRLVRNKLKFDSIFMSGRIFNWLTMDRDQHGFSGFGRIHPSIHPAQLLRWIIYCSPLVAHSCIPPCDEAASPDQTQDQTRRESGEHSPHWYTLSGILWRRRERRLAVQK